MMLLAGLLLVLLQHGVIADMGIMNDSAYAEKLENKLDLLEAKYEIALAALTALGNMKTSGGGPDSLMAFYAREALKEIKEVKK